MIMRFLCKAIFLLIPMTIGTYAISSETEFNTTWDKYSKNEDGWKVELSTIWSHTSVSEDSQYDDDDIRVRLTVIESNVSGPNIYIAPWSNYCEIDYCIFVAGFDGDKDVYQYTVKDGEIRISDPKEFLAKLRGAKELSIMLTLLKDYRVFFVFDVDGF